MQQRMNVVESLRCFSTVGHTNFQRDDWPPEVGCAIPALFLADASRHAKPSTLEKVAPLLRGPRKTLSPFGLTQVASALQAKPLLLEAGVDSAARASSKPKHFLNNPGRLCGAMVSEDTPTDEKRVGWRFVKGLGDLALQFRRTSAVNIPVIPVHLRE